MSNPFQLTFTLKQHTPIIHFQHEQAGATLRATEVKPKLDRFIMEKLTNKKGYEAVKEFECRTKKKNEDGSINLDFNEQWQSWLVGKGKNEHVALDYKIYFKDYDNKSIESRSFGNITLITEELEDKKAIWSDKIDAVILCLIPSLKENIKTTISLFFLKESFGTRQNKGWGCYYHQDHDTWDKVKEDLVKIGKAVYICTDELDNKKKYFMQTYKAIIDEKWKPLKSGVNFRTYKKSLLFKYLSGQNFRWDKRWMKHKLKELIDLRPAQLPADLLYAKLPNEVSLPNSKINRCNNNSIEKNSWSDDAALNYPYRFGRAMLGLAEHIEFRAQNNYLYQVIIKNEQGIERFKAPITFKIFDNRLYAIAEQPANMFDKTFTFTIQKKKKPNGGGKPVNEGSPFNILDTAGSKATLSTPLNQSEFDLICFLDTFFSCLNLVRLTSENQNEL